MSFMGEGGGRENQMKFGTRTPSDAGGKETGLQARLQNGDCC